MTRSRATVVKIIAACATGMGFLIVFGCGDDSGLAKRYPVSGTVNYNGKAVAQGRIDFVPAKGGEGRAATGDIVDGSYSLTTANSGDGAIPGSYKVTVIAMDRPATKAASKFGGAPSQQEVVRLNKQTKPLVPAKFSDAQTTPLKAEVKAESLRQNFDLTD
jgi:hypothetical protein